MKKTAFLRGFSLVLAAILTLGLTACGNGGGNGTASEEGGGKTENYIADYIDLPIEADYISRMIVSDERVYICYQISGQSEENAQYSIASFSLDGSDYQEMSFELDSSANPIDFALDNEGDFWLLSQINEGEGVAYSLAQFDGTGSSLLEADINAICGDLSANGVSLSALVMDEDDNLYIAGYDEQQNSSFFVADNTGAPLFQIDVDGYAFSQFKTAEGQIAVCPVDLSDTASMDFVLQFIDAGTGDWSGEELSISYPAGLYTGLSHSFYLNDMTDVYGYDLETGESQVIFNWVEAGMSPDVALLQELDDGRFIVLEGKLNSSASAYSYKMAILGGSSDSNDADKTVLTLASLYPDSAVSSAVAEFNNSNDEYKIEIKQYFNFTSDYTQQDILDALSLLNTDITSGNMPDILDLTNLPVDLYYAKGLLEDLFTYLDKDPDFNRSDFNENVLSALSIDGALPYITNGVAVISLVAGASEVGDEAGWTASDFSAFLAKHSDLAEPLGSYMSNDTFMTYMLYANTNLIDWNTGECSFTSEEFIDLLELAGHFPSSDDLDENSATVDDYQSIVDGTQIASLGVFTSVYQIAMYNDAFGGNANIIGLPADEGVCHVLEASMKLGISSKSEYADVAWSFIRTFLEEERQESSHLLPIRNSSFDNVMAKAMEGDSIYASVYGDYEITQEDVNELKNLLDAAEYTTSYEQTVIDIVLEEAAAYFAGSQTAETIASNIQNRIQTYVNEQR